MSIHLFNAMIDLVLASLGLEFGITLRRAERPYDGLTYPTKHSPTLRRTSPLYNDHNDPTIK